MLNSNSCVICNDSISDPVCVNCYIKQTRVLLKDLGLNFLAINFISNKLKNIFSIETLNDNECILCKKENLTLCRYCFSVRLVRILRELNFTEDLIDNFKYNQIHEEISLQDEIIFEDELEEKQYE